jgi:hypothetical protein
MKNNLLKYFEYEKNNLEIKEGDFLRILNKIELVEKDSFVTSAFSFDIRNLFEKVNGREIFAFSFGTAGFALAAFMFFINTQNQNSNVAQVATISQEQIQDLRNKSEQTIDAIDKINSFDNLTGDEF